MTATIQKRLSDSAGARWAAMFIVAFTMMMGYYLTDVMSPLEDMLETPVTQGGFGMGWTSQEYGFFSGSYGFINVYLLMLFFGGLILDKMGVRFTGVLACGLMVVGAFVKFYAIQFVSPEPTTYVNIPFLGLSSAMVKNQVLLAALGFSLFGVGCEICGITVTKVIAKWFTGHGMALAMGIQVAMARLGTAAALGLSPVLAHSANRIAAPILLGTVCLCIGLLAYLVYCVMDRKLDRSMAAERAEVQDGGGEEEGFRFGDLKAIFTSTGFWLITLLCLLFYSGVFPFLKFAAKLMIVKYGVDPVFAGNFPAVVPFGTILLTPLFGTVYDRIGKGATLMLIGSLMLTLVHVLFALPVMSNAAFAIVLMVLLGIAFSLVPSAMWPSVPKIIPMKQLGSAYAIIFYIQNIGLSMVPILIGNVLQRNTTLVDGEKVVDFTQAMWIFAAFGCAAVLLALSLRLIDGRKHYGLEQANAKK
ncbi:MAG: MFS transporter [Bacteroidaceae bacterium]|nr:MFS transporter [Bacteroidaceae bacterium]